MLSNLRNWIFEVIDVICRYFYIHLKIYQVIEKYRKIVIRSVKKLDNLLTKIRCVKNSLT